MQDKISEAFNKAKKLLKENNDDIRLLTNAVATFLFVHSAQGVIDNGGYRYFFESNWPQTPEYVRFAEAYSAIGCETQAAELSRIVATFPFDNSHINEDGRNKYMDENYDEDAFEIEGWGDELCGDDTVWEKLEVFYLEHITDFGA
jgi:hypothetical protein